MILSGRFTPRYAKPGEPCDENPQDGQGMTRPSWRVEPAISRRPERPRVALGCARIPGRLRRGLRLSPLTRRVRCRDVVGVPRRTRLPRGRRSVCLRRVSHRVPALRGVLIGLRWSDHSRRVRMRDRRTVGSRATDIREQRCVSVLPDRTTAPSSRTAGSSQFRRRERLHGPLPELFEPSIDRVREAVRQVAACVDESCLHSIEPVSDGL